MNPIQKQLLLLGVAVMVAMGIFPPWVRIHQNFAPAAYATAQGETQEPAGYSFIGEPPLANQQDYYSRGHRNSYGRLLMQWAAAAFVTGAVLIYFKDSDKKSLKEWLNSLTRDKQA